MKTHQRILLVIYAALIGLSPYRSHAQAVVHDPVHMGANAVAFGKDLQEAMAQTQQFFQLITNTKQQFEVLTKLKDLTSKVATWVVFMSEVEDCARLAAYSISSIANAVKIVSSGELQPYEIRSALNMYTGCLRNVNNCITAVQDVITEGQELTNKERSDKIKEKKEALQENQNKVDEASAKIAQEVHYRRVLKNDIRSGDVHRMFDVLEMIPISAIPVDPEGKLSIIEKYDVTIDRYDVSWDIDEKTFSPAVQESVSANTTAKNYQKLTDPAAKMFYAISALIGILGIVRVFTKWNLGEDIVKTAFIWLGTSVFLSVIGYFVPLFMEIFK